MLVVTQRNIVSNFTVITCCIHSIYKFESCFFVFALFVENASFVDNDIGVFVVALTKKRFSMLDLILLVSDERLKEDDFLLGIGVADRLSHL